jgi:hypothetical protein
MVVTNFAMSILVFRRGSTFCDYMIIMGCGKREYIKKNPYFANMLIFKLIGKYERKILLG